VITNQKFKAGDVIIRENDPGSEAYTLEVGRVEVTKEVAGKRVQLAQIYPGETFGEMSMIDDKPRSASVTALEDTEVRVIPRDEFFEAFRTNPDVAAQVLRTLMERLRDASATIVTLQKEAKAGVPLPSTSTEVAVPDFLVRADTVVLSGVTPQTAQILADKPAPIEKFPFRIGRESTDPLVHNDMSLADSIPFQISRHHVAIVNYEGHIGVMDRGSTLGGFVDGQAFGGPDGDPGPIFFGPTGGTLILGTEQSPFKFRLVVGRDRDIPEDWGPPSSQAQRSGLLTRLFHGRG